MEEARAWEASGLYTTDKLHELAEVALTIADSRAETETQRKELVATVRAFRATPSAERNVGALIKRFQAEVDALTLRQQRAEDAFLDVYRALDGAPDPTPALRAGAQSEKRLADAEKELAARQAQLDDYDREFTELKNQEATIRRLQRQLREVTDSASTEESAIASLRRQVDDHARERGQLVAAAAAAEADAASRLLRARDEARRNAVQLAAARDELFDLRAQYERSQAAGSEELDALREELEETRGRLGTYAVGGGIGGGDDGGTSERGHARAAATGMEELLAAREAQLSAATAQLKQAEARDAEHASTRDRHVAQLTETRSMLEAAQRELNARVPEAQVAALRAELVELRAAVPEAASAPAASTRKTPDADHEAHAELQRLEARVAQLQSSLEQSEELRRDGEQALESCRASERSLALKLTERAEAIVALEDELLQARRVGATTPATPKALADGAQVLSSILSVSTPTAATGAAADDIEAGLPAAASDAPAADMVSLVRNQRDRARREATELATLVSNLKEAASKQQAAARKLHADNLELFEKLKFARGAARADGGGAGQERRIDVGAAGAEARYAKVYEDKVSPFYAFQRRERLARLAELSAVERIGLSLARLCLRSRKARLLLFGYLASLHALVSLTIFARVS